MAITFANDINVYIYFNNNICHYQHTQQDDAAMGSPVSPIVANLYMEQFENQAIHTAPLPPLFCRRFVDDTFINLQSSNKAEFYKHLHSIDMYIQFTSEEAGDDGSIPFLDVLITPDKEGNLTTTLYRKPTRMDLYLQWDSNHTVASKYSVVDSLQHRANTISSNARPAENRRKTPASSSPKMQVSCMGYEQSKHENQNCHQQT